MVVRATSCPFRSSSLMVMDAALAPPLNRAMPVLKVPVVSTGKTNCVKGCELPTPASVTNWPPGSNTEKMAETPIGRSEVTRAAPAVRVPAPSVCRIRLAPGPRGTLNSLPTPSPPRDTRSGAPPSSVRFNLTLTPVLLGLKRTNVVLKLPPSYRPSATWAS